MPDRLLAAAALVVPLALSPLLPGAGGERARAVCRTVDPQIVESSGLVALPDGSLVTANDSGDSARVFVLDDRCRTVRQVRWGSAAVDVEALAPAGGDAVWVGDIGDNRRQRDSVTVAHVPLSGGDPTSYVLRYPGPPSDAEALVADGGRLFVITKDVFGGQVYAAPPHLDPAGVNRLRPVGSVPGLVTDAALLPGRRRLLVRTYTDATLLTWPALEPVRTFPLPSEEQGEGLAVDGRGRVLLSSEGTDRRILALRIPSTPGSGTASPSSAGSAQPVTTGTGAERSGRPRPWAAWPWAAGAVALGAALLLVRRSRR